MNSGGPPLMPFGLRRQSVEIDGRTDRITEGELIGYLLKQHQPDESVKTVLLRGSKRMELLLPIQ